MGETLADSCHLPGDCGFPLPLSTSRDRSSKVILFLLTVFQGDVPHLIFPGLGLLTQITRHPGAEADGARPLQTHGDDASLQSYACQWGTQTLGFDFCRISKLQGTQRALFLVPGSKESLTETVAGFSIMQQWFTVFLSP